MKKSKISIRIIAVIAAFAVAFTFLPAASGGLDSLAASAPGRVMSIKLKAKGQSITVKWSKVKKNVSGYTIYRNGKAIKSVGKKTTSFKDKKIKAGRKYTYYVKAFKKNGKKRLYGKASLKKTINVKAAKKKKAAGTEQSDQTAKTKTYSYRTEFTTEHDKITIVIKNIEGDPTVRISKDGKTLADLNSENTTCVVDNLKADTTYNFLFTVFVNGKEVKKVTRTASTSEAPTTTTENEDEKILFRVTWKEVSGAKEYVIIRNEKEFKTVSAPQTVFEDTDIKARTSYFYSVKAIMEDGTFYWAEGLNIEKEKL